jgi:hypothetical protein
MSEINDGGPAFPTTAVHSAGGSAITVAFRHDGIHGMTLRDYFAAKVVASAFVRYMALPSGTPEVIALAAYQMADAMLKARES